MRHYAEATRDWNSYLRQSLTAAALNYNIFYKYQGLLLKKWWFGMGLEIQLKTEAAFLGKNLLSTFSVQKWDIALKQLWGLWCSVIMEKVVF